MALIFLFWNLRKIIVYYDTSAVGCQKRTRPELSHERSECDIPAECFLATPHVYRTLFFIKSARKNAIFRAHFLCGEYHITYGLCYDQPIGSSAYLALVACVISIKHAAHALESIGWT